MNTIPSLKFMETLRHANGPGSVHLETPHLPDVVSAQPSRVSLQMGQAPCTWRHHIYQTSSVPGP